MWELRDSNPRPSACKEKKTSFQIFNPHSMYWLLTTYILLKSIWFSVFSVFFLLFLHIFCEKNLTGHKLKKTLSGPFLWKKIVDFMYLFLVKWIQIMLGYSSTRLSQHLSNCFNRYSWFFESSSVCISCNLGSPLHFLQTPWHPHCSIYKKAPP